MVDPKSMGKEGRREARMAASKASNNILPETRDSLASSGVLAI